MIGGYGMRRKAVSMIMLTLLLTSMLTLTSNVRLVEASGTIYIRADGSIDPPTANITTIDNVTYNFTDNNYDSVVVERNNILIRGLGYTLRGPGSEKGIDLTGRSNVTVMNVKIESFPWGIWLDGSSNNTISGNNITNSGYGIYLHSSSNNSISGNNVANNGAGIWFEYLSNNNTLSENNVTTSSLWGIHMVLSRYNVFRDNKISDNSYNFEIAGLNLSEYNHDIDCSNTVDGKPICYMVNQHNREVPANAGFVGIINSTNIVVKNLTIEKNGQGILLAYTNDSVVENVTVTNNDCGIWIQSSHGNIVRGNIAVNNCFEGTRLNSGGLVIWRSKQTNITENIMKNNFYGIYLAESSNNNISLNNITNSVYQGISIRSSSDYNSMHHNNFVDNSCQVNSEGSPNIWDYDYPSGGNYWSDYNGLDLFSGRYQNETGSDGIGDTAYTVDAENQDSYPLMKPYGGPHDIGMTTVNISKTIVAEGYNLTVTMNATIVNYGEQAETFNCTFQTNTTIQEQTLTLTSRNSTTLTFKWNTTGLAEGNYTIGAVVDMVPGETDTTDNAHTGWVVITIPGDFDGSRKVNYEDLFRLADAYGSIPDDWNWDPNCDINDNGRVEFDDLFILADNYGTEI
jgi:parallel beta-helix repeat protein